MILKSLREDDIIRIGRVIGGYLLTRTDVRYDLILPEIHATVSGRVPKLIQMYVLSTFLSGTLIKNSPHCSFPYSHFPAVLYE